MNKLTLIFRIRTAADRCLSRLVRLCKDWPWQYGVCTAVSTKRARRHRLTGEVQFVLWEKGYQVGDYTYADDYWTSYDKSWWGHFLQNAGDVPRAAKKD